MDPSLWRRGIAKAKDFIVVAFMVVVKGSSTTLILGSSGSSGAEVFCRGCSLRSSAIGGAWALGPPTSAASVNFEDPFMTPSLQVRCFIIRS